MPQEKQKVKKMRKCHSDGVLKQIFVVADELSRIPGVTVKNHRNGFTVRDTRA